MPPAQDHPTSSTGITIVPFGEDPLSSLAETLLDDFSADLPDLSQALVLLPDLQCAPRLRRILLEGARRRGIEALLGPRTERLVDWVAGHPLAAPVIGAYARELLLVEALHHHPHIFGAGNPWTLADALFELFDELTLARTELPPDPDAFTERLLRGYGEGAADISALHMESRLVHTLWHAWHRQMQEEGMLDRGGAYALRLAGAAERAGAKTRIYTAGFHRLAPAERSLLARLGETGCGAHFFAHGEPGQTMDAAPPETPPAQAPFARFVEAVFAQEGALRDRAATFAEALSQSPAQTRLCVAATGGAEQEARAVDLQVRRWLVQGKRQIGIVTENRRLARRVRALLERAGVPLQDAAGWALSTTSAAAVLERWLQCVEEDFPYEPMLDLLKSPFIAQDEEREALLEQVYRLEQDIVHHENVGRGLKHYRRHLRFRQHRLPPELAGRLDAVAALLDELEKAAAPLLPLHTGRHRAEAFLDALKESLDALGLEDRLGRDAAGVQILQTIERMGHGLPAGLDPLDWPAFRSWLGRALERATFRPPVRGDRVVLMGLAQSRLQRFDGLVIAAAEREYLPGSPTTSPFFNDAVRRELGLAASEEQMAERFYDFRRLLEAAPAVCITLRRRQDDEDIPPSPWVEALRAFHHLAYGTDLADGELVALAERPEASLSTPVPGAAPERTVRPAPSAAATLLPESVSASAYQQLMDCPYQFYAAQCLRLAPPEAIREALEKSDYGERVHRCLEAFHGGVDGLPGPFAEPLTTANREAASALLETIARRVFAKDTEDNFLHRGWLQRWLALIPAYIEWQIHRASEWHPHAVEVRAEGEAGRVRVHGRLDRIDDGQAGLAVVDYKTGAVPREADVTSGESVQLPFYALLAQQHFPDPVGRVEYLSLDQGRVVSRAPQEGEALDTLTGQVAERLETLVDQMRAGAGLSAWGDEVTCGRCSMEGVCRRQAWLSAATLTHGKSAV
jgi:ATP-dependent helicase/nuclease subunit B